MRYREYSWLMAGVMTCVSASAPARAQVITTVAGTDFFFPASTLPGGNAPLGAVSGIAVDRNGNVYAADPSNNMVMRISPTGSLSVFAGNGTVGESGDGGPASSAALIRSAGVAVDGAGNVFIDDGNMHRVLADGTITTVARAESFGASIPFTKIAADTVGNLYISNVLTYRIFKLTPGGMLSSIAGNGSRGFSGDGGPATSAQIGDSAGLAVDSAGSVYISDGTNNLIRKVTPGGNISTVARFAGPVGVAVDIAGNLYVTTQSSQVFKVTPSGTITIVALNWPGGFAGSRGLYSPVAIAVDAIGNLYIADTLNYRILKISQTGIIDTLAGNGAYRFSGDGGTASSATLRVPSSVAVDAIGNVYIADKENGRIRRLAPDGTISTIAGNGNPASPREGLVATDCYLHQPLSVALDRAGNLYFADGAVYKVGPDGKVARVAGSGAGDSLGDNGLATSAALSLPSSVAVAETGDVYIADTLHNRIRKVSTTGIITTVAGNGTGGFSGDGGPAISAALFYPMGVTLDAAGNLYIADQINHRIRKVSPAGTITTIAGTGGSGLSGDGGPATSAELDFPGGVAVDAADNLYVTGGSSVRKISTNGTITSVAGTRTQGFSGDGGPATNAELRIPAGVAFDVAGNLFIADSGNSRIRKILVEPPSIQTTVQSLSFSGNANGAPTPKQSFSIIASAPGVSFSVSTDASWLRLPAQSAVTPALIEVSADPTGLAPGTHSATISITAPYATPPSITIPVTFVVAGGVGPALGVDKLSLSFPFPRAGSARSQTVTVSNAGGGTLNFTVAAAGTSGNWLSVLPTIGTARPGLPVALTATVDPKGLLPGTYTGQVSVSSAAGNQTIPVTMTISDLDRAILLSQTGLSFAAVAQGGVVPPQSFAVLNIGTGVVNWSTSKLTLSGGQDWLVVSPTNGSSDAAGQSPSVAVGVSPARLVPGKYYGLVRVDAPGAANTPQVLTVFLQVLPQEADVGAVVQPAEIQFTAVAGAASPGSQDLLVYNMTPAAKSFRSSVVADAGLQLVILPKDATLNPQQPTRIVVQPFTNGLGRGVYNGTVTLQFSDGRVSSVRVTVIVSKEGAGNSSPSQRETSSAHPADMGSCSPTQLLPALTTLGQSFAVSAGWPVALGVDVKDDCGAPLETGVVSVSFSSGDPPLLLQSLKGGRWEGTWPTSNTPRAQVTLTLKAEDPSTQIRGERSVSGALESQQDPPVFEKSGVVSVASGQPYVALAPGSVVSIFGDRLAENTQAAQTAPLPTQLVDTEVIMNDQKLPLYYVEQHQVNAIVPYQLNVNTTHQLLVRRGLTYSQVVNVDVAPAQPSAFVANGYALAVAYRTSMPPFLVSPLSPTMAGDTLVIYCAGLGATNPPAADGAASAASATKDPVTLTIGGQNAPVSYAGLTPGSVGLYQVNAAVPSGAPAGDSVPVILTVAGQISPVANLAVR